MHKNLSISYLHTKA